MALPKLYVTWRHPDANIPWGRFGGGWQWELGIQTTRIRKTRGIVIINLLVAYVRIEWSWK